MDVDEAASISFQESERAKKKYIVEHFDLI